MRLRVLEALELAAKQFRTREELFPIRIPREPIRLDDIVERALGDDSSRFDPASLRARTILHLEWDDGSVWDAWVIMLPSQLRLFCDSGAEETRVLASGGRNAGDETDRQFLTLLSESAGETFGIEMAGGAPARVRSSIADRAVPRRRVREPLRGARHGDRRPAGPRRTRSRAWRPSPPENTAEGIDFRVDVERWLELVAR